jgi:hypothetical protein
MVVMPRARRALEPTCNESAAERQKTFHGDGDFFPEYGSDPPLPFGFFPLL